ncbi:MAG: hypothetical protein PHI19_07550 [Clostridia bacterium]|nr:hypothetical protein [Clostridia bacterium]
MEKIHPEHAKDFANPYKIALIATKDSEGEMHISLISTLMAKGEDRMMCGEFIVGLSKEYFHQYPESGFIIMNLKKEFWSGKMKFRDEISIAGEDFDLFNSMPLYRYNSYFGINKVHYADLVEISDKRALDMGGIIFNTLKVLAAKPFVKCKQKNILKPWAKSLTTKADTLMFLAYEGQDGYPEIVPIIQGQSVCASRIVFTAAPYKKELSNLKKGAKASVYAVNLKMEAVLIKGVFTGFKNGIGSVEIQRVYNPMPPKHGYIY